MHNQHLDLAHSNYQPRLWLLLLLLLPALAAAGCGDDDESNGDGLEPEPTEPISVVRAQRGVGIFTGDATTIGARASELVADTSWGVIRTQLQDELMVSREGDMSIPDAMFGRRVGALKTEMEAGFTMDRWLVVVDFMRLSDGQAAGAPAPYMIRWDDNDRPDERYGFWRDDYRTAVIDEISEGVASARPDALVFGAEMERLISIAESDYANYVTLYREGYAAVKTASPNTRVGAGVDWVRFQLDVVPQMVLLAAELPAGSGVAKDVLEVPCNALPGDADTDKLSRACTDKAFRRFIEPLLRYPDPNQPEDAEEVVYIVTADFLALSAQPTESDFGNTPANVPEDFFGYLRRWSLQFPVFYYAVNWGVSSNVGFTKQDEWASVIVERNNGVTIEVFAWTLLKDLVENDCNKMVNDLGAPRTLCFGGLVTTSTAPKDVFETFTTDVTP